MSSVAAISPVGSRSAAAAAAIRPVQVRSRVRQTQAATQSGASASTAGVRPDLPISLLLSTGAPPETNNVATGDYLAMRNALDEGNLAVAQTDYLRMQVDLQVFQSQIPTTSAPPTTANLNAAA